MEQQRLGHDNNKLPGAARKKTKNDCAVNQAKRHSHNSWMFIIYIYICALLLFSEIPLPCNLPSQAQHSTTRTTDGCNTFELLVMDFCAPGSYDVRGLALPAIGTDERRRFLRERQPANQNR